jgi:hypothetical protein
MDFVAGSSRVPNPATGTMALMIGEGVVDDDMEAPWEIGKSANRQIANEQNAHQQTASRQVGT